MNVAYVAWSPALFLLHRSLVDWPSGNWHADYADLHFGKAQQVPQLQSSQQATAMASMPSMPAYVPAPGLDWPPGMSTAQFPMFCVARECVSQCRVLGSHEWYVNVCEWSVGDRQHFSFWVGQDPNFIKFQNFNPI